MQIKTKIHKVDLSGTQGQRAFTVKAGAHIMQVLSGLYSNPVDAMVREYLTNMYDAYIALKRDNPSAEIIPPVLRLPTALSGHLEFQDFGIGMSKDTVWNVYATYGESTKNGNNDEVGGFGLGSKTAFCYNDGASWSIISRFQGEKHTFMAFIGKDGVPNLTHVSSVPTDEHSGVTVAVPIRREDMAVCVEAARKYAPLFPMELIVEGTTIEPVEYILRSTDWGFRNIPDNNNNYYTSQYYRSSASECRVIMGNVPYKVNMDSVRNAVVTDRDVGAVFNHNRIDLYVPVGAVDIVPSRDDMKYTPRTIRAIKNAVGQMITELPRILERKISTAKTEWEFRVMAHELVTGENSVYGLRAYVKELKFNGSTLSSENIERPLTTLQALDPSATADVYGIDSDSKSQIVHSLPTTLEVNPNKNNTFVVVDDMPKGGVAVVRGLVYNKLVNRGHNGRARRYGHTKGHAILLKTTLTAAQIGELFGGMPADKVLFTSKLSGTISIPQAAKGIKETIYRWSGSSWQARVNIPSDPKTTYHYLPLTKDAHNGRWSYVGRSWGSQKDTMTRVCDALEQTGTTDYVVYGIRDTELDLVKNKKNWINVLTHLESTLTAAIIADSRSLALGSLSTSGKLDRFHRVMTALPKLAAIPDLKNLQKTLDVIANARNSKVMNLRRTYETIIPDLSKKVESAIKNEMLTGNIPDVEKEYNSIKTKFPMFVAMMEFAEGTRYGNYSGVSDTCIQTTLDYLKQIA